jgi:hypothetical protein
VKAPYFTSATRDIRIYHTCGVSFSITYTSIFKSEKSGAQYKLDLIFYTRG